VGERTCLRCGNCCKTFDVNLIPPDMVIELLKAHYGREVDRIWIRAKHQCEQLVEDGKGKYKCLIYKNRPEICKNYVCDYLKGSDIGRFVQFVIGEDNVI
jgi:Fe-S-cluster containining protein